LVTSLSSEGEYLTVFPCAKIFFIDPPVFRGLRDEWYYSKR
jgi:hypothetical protein